MNDITDLNPMLRRRKQSACEHVVVLVDEALAFLECEACQKELSPYWWIGRLCAEWNQRRKELLEYEDKILKAHQQSVAMMNHRAARLQAEIETLEAKKRQLMQEQVGGAPLGKQVKRWKRAP